MPHAVDLSRLDDLLREAAVVDDDLFADSEPSFAAVLNFLIEHPELRPAAAERFIRGLLNDPAIPPELIEYCMFELRWSEVQQAAKDLVQSVGIREQAVLKGIIGSFSDRWYGKTAYRRWR